jgi:uncharacterized protein (TIGR03435 family)
MTEHGARESHSDGKLLLITLTQIAVVVILNMLGQACAAQSGATSRAGSPDGGRPHFDVATIKLAKSKSGYPVAKAMPDGMRGSNLTVLELIGDAYRLNSFEIDHVSGLPKWATSNRYDVNAKVLGSDADELSKLLASNWNGYKDREDIMLQTLLADRFKLAFHKEPKILPIYELVISKNGPKIKEGKTPDPMYPKGILRWAGRGKITAQGVSIGRLASEILTRQVDRPVVDKTGLAGTYDFTLQWRLEEGPSPMSGGPTAGEQVSPPSQEIDGPSIFAALPEQLGLKLQPTKGPVDILVIDHIEQPSEN